MKRRGMMGLMFLAAVAALALFVHAPSAEANTNWSKCYTLKMSDTAMDAGATSKTVTLAPIYGHGRNLEVEDVYVSVTTAFDRTTDGGPTTMTLDVGKSGATNLYASAVDLQTASNSFGSNTLDGEANLGSRHYEGTSLTPVLTVTSGVANINTNNQGRVVVCFKYGALPVTP